MPAQQQRPERRRRGVAIRARARPYDAIITTIWLKLDVQMFRRFLEERLVYNYQAMMLPPTSREVHSALVCSKYWHVCFMCVAYVFHLSLDAHQQMEKCYTLTGVHPAVVTQC